MKKIIFSGAIATALLAAGAAQAGGCCYQKVTTPAVYQTYQ